MGEGGGQGKIAYTVAYLPRSRPLFRVGEGSLPPAAWFPGAHGQVLTLL